MPDEQTVVAEAEGSWQDFLASNGFGISPAADEAEADPYAAGEDEEVNSPEDAAGSAPVSEQPKQESKKVASRKEELQREIDQLVKRRGELQRELEAPEKPAPAPVSRETKPANWDGSDPGDPRPDQTKYSDWEQWTRDITRWEARCEFRLQQHKAEQAAEQRKAEEARKTQEEAGKKVLADFERRGVEFAAEQGNEDYPDLVEESKKTPICDELGYVVLNAPGRYGPATLKALMQDRDAIRKINALPTPGQRFARAYEFALKIQGWNPPQSKAAPPKKSQAQTATRPPRSEAPSPEPTEYGAWVRRQMANR